MSNFKKSIAVTHGAEVQGARTDQFDIPSKKLSQALRKFSAASAQHIVFSKEVVGYRSASALRGSYTGGRVLLVQSSDFHVESSRIGALVVQSKNVRAALDDRPAGRSSTGAVIAIVSVTAGKSTEFGVSSPAQQTIYHDPEHLSCLLVRGRQ